MLPAEVSSESPIGRRLCQVGGRHLRVAPATGRGPVCQYKVRDSDGAAASDPGIARGLEESGMSASNSIRNLATAADKVAAGISDYLESLPSNEWSRPSDCEG